MVGRVNEIVKKTHETWVKFFVDKPYFLTPPVFPPKSSIQDTSIDGKGKGILGLDSPVLEQKLIEDIPLAVSPVHNVEKPVYYTEVVHDKKDTPKHNILDVEVIDIDIDNKQLEDIEPLVTNVHT